VLWFDLEVLASVIVMSTLLEFAIC